MDVIVQVEEKDLERLIRSGVSVRAMWRRVSIPTAVGDGVIKRAPGNRSPKRLNGTRQRVNRGVPISEYKPILLDVLHEFDGVGAARKGSAFYLALRQRVAHTKDDVAILQSGHERWWESMQWARLQLVHAGKLRSQSPHSVWEVANRRL